MRTFAELEALYRALPPAPARGTVKLIVVRPDEGVHETPSEARLDLERGIVGDRWLAKPDRDTAAQVTLMNAGVAELVAAGVQPLHMPGDNFLVDMDLGTATLPTGTRVRVGGAVVEVTDKPHLGCYKFSARFGQDALRWVNWVGHRERRLRGLHARILEPGAVALGDVVEVLA